MLTVEVESEDTDVHQLALRHTIPITSKNYTEMFQNKWFVAILAPWCGACAHFHPIWESIAEMKSSEPEKMIDDNDELVNKVDTNDNHQILKDINFATIIVTENPELVAQFGVTYFPSIYFIKNGEFWFYEDENTLDDLYDYIKYERWNHYRSLPWYSSPNGPVLKAASYCIKISLKLKEISEGFEAKYNLSKSYVYLIIGLIILGILAILSLCFVIMIDILQNYYLKYFKVKTEERIISPMKMYPKENYEIPKEPSGKSSSNDEDDMIIIPSSVSEFSSSTSSIDGKIELETKGEKTNDEETNTKLRKRLPRKE
ncbi:hypothetical protein SNEBB_001582 [Seison nebaliae]|nr:hypothetical protein SNEBB_001582 [Seison nebaliae]